MAEGEVARYLAGEVASLYECVTKTCGVNSFGKCRLSRFGWQDSE